MRRSQRGHKAYALEWEYLYPGSRAKTDPCLPVVSRTLYTAEPMPLQNRGTWFGDIDAIAGVASSLATADRPRPRKTLLTKRWASKAWLICVCEFSGCGRSVMGGPAGQWRGYGGTRRCPHRDKLAERGALTYRP